MSLKTSKLGENQLTIILRKLLQAHNDVILWCTGPCALRDEVCSHGLILFVPEHASGALSTLITYPESIRVLVVEGVTVSTLERARTLWSHE